MLLVVSLCVTLVALSTADDCNVGGTDVWWGDIYNWYAPNFQACKDRCRTDSRCRAVVYYHWGAMEGKCFLKNGDHGSRISCAWCTAAFEPCISQEGPCSAGQYKSSRLACSTCPANTYSGAGSGSCTSCPTGHFSGAGASSCSPCSAGTYNGDRGGSCKQCPANTYSSAGSGSCTSCPTGHFSGVGASSCSPCSAGTFNGEQGGSCKQCPANTYSSAGSVSCTSCPTGHISGVGASSCSPCPAGTFNGEQEESCKPCPANTYSSAGSGSCTSCPVGHFSGVGASSCSPCPAGTFNGEQGGSCKPCPADTFNDQSGAANCTPCGDEGYISLAGSSSADNCILQNGAHCWGLYDNVRLTGSYGKAMSYDKANTACFDDEDCTGVTCRRRKGKKGDKCYLARGEKHKQAKKKWYISLKEC